MTINDSIKEISKNAQKPLLYVSEIGAKNIKEFTFDCATLEDYSFIPIHESEKFKPIFDDLRKMSGPCLYCFEVISNQTTDEIISNIKAYSLRENPRSTPAIKTQIPDSRFLYVGKVKRHMWGRVIQHLGFFKTAGTQGLQLFYWAQQLELCLKLTVLEFEPDMSELMGVLENDLARRLKPILGKHK